MTTVTPEYRKWIHPTLISSLPTRGVARLNNGLGVFPRRSGWAPTTCRIEFIWRNMKRCSISFTTLWRHVSWRSFLMDHRDMLYHIVNNMAFDDLATREARVSVATVQCTGKAIYWRHNERDGVSNHHRLECLLKRLFRRRSKKTSKLRATGLCEGNSPGTGEFPTPRGNNAENVLIWWRNHGPFHKSKNLQTLHVATPLGFNLLRYIRNRSLDRYLRYWCLFINNDSNKVALRTRIGTKSRNKTLSHGILAEKYHIFVQLNYIT